MDHGTMKCEAHETSGHQTKGQATHIRAIRLRLTNWRLSMTTLPPQPLQEKGETLLRETLLRETWRHEGWHAGSLDLGFEVSALIGILPWAVLAVRMWIRILTGSSIIMLSTMRPPWYVGSLIKFGFLFVAGTPWRRPVELSTLEA